MLLIDALRDTLDVSATGTASFHMDIKLNDFGYLFFSFDLWRLVY